jgi:hypothetical protein
MAQYSYGLDMTKPLNKQAYYGSEETTWADYFVDAAISSAKSTYAMYEKAVSENHKLTEDEQASLDFALANLNKEAVESGFSGAKEYLQAVYGYGATVASYNEYVTRSALAQSYYAAYADTLDFDKTAISDYDKEHTAEFSSYSFSYYYLSSDKFLQGGTKGEDDKITYSDEEKQAALDAAKDAAESLLGAETAQVFNTNVKNLEINAENENAAITTLDDTFYSDSKIPSAVRDWLAEGDRKQGEMAVVPNTVTSTDDEGNELTVTSGYYVVYFEKINDNNSKMANVRHILFAFEGGTTDSDGNTVYSEAEKASAKKKAEDLLAQWLAGDATEDSFAALVHDNTDDDGSKENGGLYEDINEDTTFVEPFLTWALADHKAGDTEIIETEYGYHIMYYSSTDELTYREALISATLENEAMEEWYNSIVDAVTVKEGDVSKMRLDLILTPGKAS